MAKKNFTRRTSQLGLAACALLAAAACGSRSGNDGNDTDDNVIDAATTDGGPCVGLQCFQVSCPSGGTTSISGTVNAPNGSLPLYNVTVYVPNAPVAALAETLTCDQCGGELSGNPLVQVQTDTNGRFVLENMPATGNVPVVIKIGKWRRQIVIPAVPACTDTPLAADDVRLPATQAEGDIPRMALTTGGADPLECLLRKIGLDDSEFTNPGGGGRINMFAGSGGSSSYDGGATFPSVTELWDDAASLSAYDVVLASCEGGQNEGNKGPAALAAMDAYTAAGGRLFAEHWHNYWLQNGAGQLADVANWDLGLPDLGNITATVNTDFPRGADLAEWLVNTGASTTLGQIDIVDAQHTATALDPTLADRWIYSDADPNSSSVQYLALTTPLTAPEDERCGKIVFSDIHVSSGDGTGQAFPTGCSTLTLSPQEKVLAFMLFDIASCVEAPID